ncbi:hypothetical protein GR160_12490 [Flavobacterium sp. Sd200]|uniref:hypothetical protein n=1 Tax=Flavobacterium sp. Sd200 TaxID=2692211 RepID=UPI00136C1F7D|nr:hypothetical protein [Flavobacterium sp. Sd200]MXN92045.1 hypothetical protein [Flavobacterium sp. Sd200]
MKPSKKILKIAGITLGTLIVLLTAANFIAESYISKKLPEIIKNKKDFPYNLSYTSLDVNLLGGSFTMHNAALAPKDSMQAAVKNGVFGKIKTVKVRGLSLWQLYKHKRIKVNRVAIDSPEIILYQSKKKYDTKDDVEKPFKTIIETGSISISNGSFKLLDDKMNPKLRAANISLDISNIKADSTTIKKNIPVRYRDYNFACDSLFYNAGQFYNIALNKIAATDASVNISNFRLIPKHTRKQFVGLIDKELDQFNLQADSIAVPKADWGFTNDTLYVHAPEVILGKVFANIYRSKEPTDDPSRKKLYSELLRNLKFDLKVDKLLLKNSVVEYEEQLTFAKPAAKVSFSKFYATIAHVYSPVNKTKLPPTTIDVQCLFMKSAPLKVKWTFNTPDVSDAFTITGHLQNIRSEEVNPVSKPLMNVETTGNIKDVKFVFNGNRERATGTFAIEYDDLKVDIYKKDGKKKNKFMSAVGNLLVKNDSNERPKKADVAVERSKDKSVFNFLWKFVMQGLKQTVLPKAVGENV